MPILPSIAAVCGIVSCFNSAASLYTAFKSRKEAIGRHDQMQGQREEEKAEQARKALDSGPKDVQHEYDRAFALVGKPFAHGDDTGRLQLMTELISLQKTVISLLQNAVSSNQLDVSQLAAFSTARRAGAINALQDQFQRMSTSAPTLPQQNFFPTYRPKLCPEAERLLSIPNAVPRYKDPLIPHPFVQGRYGMECRGCESTWDVRPVGLIRDPVSGLRYPSDFQFRCHTKLKDLYLCYLCGSEEQSPVLRGFGELMQHVRGHTQAELLRPGWSGGWVEADEVIDGTEMDDDEVHGVEFGRANYSASVRGVGTPRGSKYNTPQCSARNTPRGTPRNSPRGTPKASPRNTPRGTPYVTPRGSANNSARGTPRGSPTVPRFEFKLNDEGDMESTCNSTASSPRSSWSDWGSGSQRSSVSSVSSVLSRTSVLGKPPVGKNLELYVKPD